MLLPLLYIAVLLAVIYGINHLASKYGGNDEPKV